MEKTAGYITDVPYTHGYYRELSPCFIDFALLLNGVEPPRRAPMRYLELGYGQGLSACIHAAAVPGEFFGADFNPTHAANAQTMAEVSRSGAIFTDDSFLALAERPSLPDMDYIVLHGIWSWVNEQSRQAIIDVIRKKLKVGGAVYMSYNVLPGWAPVAPLRHILNVHMKVAGSDVQNFVERINGAIDYTRMLADKKARFFDANPSARGRLERLAEQNRNYLMHEYFNEEWDPCFCSQMHERLAHNRVSYACTASLLETIDSVNLTPEQAQILASISNLILKETVRDYMMNTQFRRDLFTCGARRLANVESLERIKPWRVTLMKNVDDFDYTLSAAGRKLALKKEVYEPLLQQLSDGSFAPKTIGELSASLETHGIPARAALEAIVILVGMGLASPVQSDDDAEKAAYPCRRLNDYLIAHSRVSGDVEYLASPVTGGGVHVNRFQQMFLLARSHGKAEPEDWAQEAWENLKAQRQSLVVEGKALAGDDENLAELRNRAKAFSETHIPILRALNIMS